jgi:hypothetical protein
MTAWRASGWMRMILIVSLQLGTSAGHFIGDAGSITAD